MRKELTPIQAEYVGRVPTAQTQAPIQLIVNVDKSTATNGRSGLGIFGFLGAVAIGVVVYSLATGQSISVSLQQLESSAGQWFNAAKEFVSAKF